MTRVGLGNMHHYQELPDDSLQMDHIWRITDIQGFSNSGTPQMGEATSREGVAIIGESQAEANHLLLGCH